MKTTLSEVEFTQKVTNKTQNKQIQKREPTNIEIDVALKVQEINNKVV